jgi:osomolarity two-component system, response regulator SKN7
MNQQIAAQAQQIDSLAHSNQQLQLNNQVMVQELMRLQKTVAGHDRVMADVMTFLHTVDKQRRDSKALFTAPGSDGTTNLTPTSQTLPVQEDEPASPLQHASKLLSDLNTEVQFNISGLEQLNTNMVPSAVAAQNPQYRQGPSSATSSGSMGYSKMNPAELEQMVYPMGVNNGIDPMYAEHVNNIPYAMPPKQPAGAVASDPRQQFADTRKKSGNYEDPGWAHRPRILLVEDDPTCRQIGGKFLYSFMAEVDTALDGLEAVSKMQEGNKYDMILMDIIMPNLDGVSACHIIRQFDRTPIVAMTSNIRSDDIQMYFQHGMDDVLPKPFTRKSLLEMLEKHLMHLKKLPDGMNPPPSAGLIPGAQSSASQSLREDVSAAVSPAASSVGTWNSPSQYSGVSPVTAQVPNNYAVPTQYMDANAAAYVQNGPQTPLGPRTPVGGPQAVHRRGVSEMAGAMQDMNANKRQRMMGHTNNPSMSAPMR